MEGAVLFSTRCMNVMLLKMFNWYIFKIFCSLKISLVFPVNFFKVCPAGTAPSYIGIVYVGLCT